MSDSLASEVPTELVGALDVVRIRYALHAMPGRDHEVWCNEGPGADERAVAITASVLLHAPAGSPIQQLSLVGGLAVAETVEQALDLSAQIKWPNDVMVNRRKVAGVLAEARDGIVVLGIGLNVNQTREQLPEDARVPPASLRTVDGVERDRAPLLADLLVRLERHYDAWTAGGLDAVFDGIGSRDFLRGRRVSVDGVEGVAGGLDRRGRLLVDGRPVESGEVELVS